MINNIQCRMARAALGLSIRQMADEADIGVTTLTRFEAADTGSGSTTRTIERLEAYFDGLGLEFSSGKGWVSVTVRDQG